MITQENTAAAWHHVAPIFVLVLLLFVCLLITIYAECSPYAVSLFTCRLMRNHTALIQLYKGMWQMCIFLRGGGPGRWTCRFFRKWSWISPALGEVPIYIYIYIIINNYYTMMWNIYIWLYEANWFLTCFVMTKKVQRLETVRNRKSSGSNRIQFARVQ